ncbi:2-amino-4-hydroxy-6-hydroxymethyldihydropteridine diphosphokinase [sulfur-oxidizing endosymbiont of Gigantopelta aegis]|uniref:2-amino-4-hydroxy-6- hydroxymethyldihydropteridine diphosphokinase n=1 Tax=sulfur-oxidizing endosymbiont of Gigantopelta aegis TaxID=2794934 RepID=UPI0018DD32C8|nr:2-amino-4-hydroxy-6-hydroxymethyldihydropteridine diphosphokinase [sulfur-oxidizing endosymbiont of Gigantopelta aegis]
MNYYIGLGSNLDKPVEQLRTALSNMANTGVMVIVSQSSFYQSRALTLPDTPRQNDYINAVVLIDSDLNPQQLLQQLHELEARQGRKRLEKWGARTLDLDILLAGERGEEIVQAENLMIPHSQIKQRNFVIHPLFEIAIEQSIDIEIPALGHLADLAKQTSWAGLERI